MGVFTIDQQIKQPEEEKKPQTFIDKIFPTKKPPKISLPIFTTSNWVLQESGYAIAKGKKIILMVKNSVNKFPELQGDSEIIPFDKGSLDKPFLKLIEMLFDNFKLGHAGTQTIPSPTESKEEPAPQKVSPPPLMEMFDAHEQKDIKKAEEIYQKKVRPSLAPEKQKFWDALLLRWQYNAGEANKFSELERTYDETKEYDVGVQLGLCYEDFDKYKEAKEVYLKCLQNITDDRKKFDCFLRIANCYSSEKDYDKAIIAILELVNNPIFSQMKEDAFLKLIKIAEEKKDDYLYFVFAEKALDINPVNNGLRFKVAYKYSNMDKEDLALYHYKKLLEGSEDIMALNNIGVAYSNLGMPSKSVGFYEKASEKKNTLANSNLAYKYLNVGFTELAEKLLKSADELSKEGIEVHENIGYAKRALKEKLEAEDKKEADVLAQVAKVHNFKIKHSEAYCEPINNTLDLSGKWMLGEWGEVEVNWNKNDGSLTGTASKDISVPTSISYGEGLLGLLTPPPTIKTRVVEIKGSIHNLAGTFRLKVTESAKGTTPSLLSSALDEVCDSSGLFIVNSSGDLIDVMEEIKNKERTYNQYKKVS